MLDQENNQWLWLQHHEHQWCRCSRDCECWNKCQCEGSDRQQCCWCWRELIEVLGLVGLQTDPHHSLLTSSHLTTGHATTASHHITSHYIASHRIASDHIASHRIASHRIASHHIASHRITSHHITSHHITSHHITSHHITSPEYSPALPMGWVPGAQPRTTGPGHHPMGGVLTVSGVRTPHCQTPPPGSPRPPSTGRLGFGNGQRPLVRAAGTASQLLSLARPPRAQSPLQSPSMRLPRAVHFYSPCRRPCARPSAPLPFPHVPPSPQEEWPTAWKPPEVGLRELRSSQVCARDKGTGGIRGSRPWGGRGGMWVGKG